MTQPRKDGKLCLNGCFTFKEKSEFHIRNHSQDGLASLCKECERKRVQVWKHGLSAAQKAEIAEKQGGCAICFTSVPGGHGWVVDHDHTCCPGERSCGSCRRGILCVRCNSALGYAGDDPARLRRMADYLESGDRITQPVGLPIGVPSRSTQSVKRARPPIARTKTDGLGRTHEEVGPVDISLNPVPAIPPKVPDSSMVGRP